MTVTNLSLLDEALYLHNFGLDYYGDHLADAWRDWSMRAELHLRAIPPCICPEPAGTDWFCFRCDGRKPQTPDESKEQG